MIHETFYIAGGMILFSIILNSFVHVIMYSYYFAALFGPAVQTKLQKIKKNITVIQMVKQKDYFDQRKHYLVGIFLTGSVLFHSITVCTWIGAKL